MTRALEITLGEWFKKFVAIYITTFPRSYHAYDRQLRNILPPLQSYKTVIINNRDPIFRAAAADVNRYLANYSVHANQSADEFKLIYFLGRAIERHLVNDGFPELARVHMFSMIGLLDFRLETKQISKTKLTKALTNLIRLNAFDSELGSTGCYLTYKCVATMASADEAAEKDKL